MLLPYFEPNDQELEEGAKQPTVAHHAIAQLVKQGFVKVIITTNFDRLIEKALDDAGIVPTILSSPDDVKGALPLTHIEHCVFKVHGDYLDTRIRNTPDELKEYPKEFDELLDRIFNEFGLIVCGWSANWDDALRNAISCASSPQFSTYWAIHGQASDQAQKLINRRSTQKILIEDADTFFQNVQKTVQLLGEGPQSPSLSTETAVANLKCYLPEPRHQIRLKDLIHNEVDRIVEATSGQAFAVQGPTWTNESATARVRGYEAVCSTLLAMAPIGGFYAEEYHFAAWQSALERLSVVSSSGEQSWLELQRYPGTLLLYAIGLGLVASDQIEFLGRLFMTEGRQTNGEVLPVVQLLPPSCLFKAGGKGAQFLKGMENYSTPLNDWLYRELRQYTKHLIPNDERYRLIFNTLEILMALGCAHKTKPHYVVPPGVFIHQYEQTLRIIDEIKNSISALKDDSPFVKSGIFGEIHEVCISLLDNNDIKSRFFLMALSSSIVRTVFLNYLN